MIYAKVKGQKIYLSGESVVADSVKYLKIYFEVPLVTQNPTLKQNICSGK